jgi:hypothetical protein
MLILDAERVAKAKGGRPMNPRPGQALVSPVDTTTVIVIRAPDHEINLTCAGVAMWDPMGGGDAPGVTTDPAQLTGSVMGKRYANEEFGIELLCTKPGHGTIAVNGMALTQRTPKRLPASD